MEVFEELLQQGLSLILFCAGVALLFIQHNQYTDLMEDVRAMNKEVIIWEQNQGGMASQFLDEANQIVSRGELISYLLHQLEYDIEIDGLSIRKTENVRGSIMNYEIQSDYYKKGYRYDEDGTMVTILFFGVD